MYDLLIKNGFVIDGTGHPGLKMDLAIKDGRIASMAPCIDVEADRVIDANGMVVCPGFIDIHSHSDRSLLANPKAESSIRQGITFVLGGQCGGSMAPLSPTELEQLRKRVPEADWLTMDDFFGRLEAKGIAINFGCLIGQGTVRSSVMGVEDRTPTDDEIAAMQAMVDQAMRDGAFGFSTGRRYMPGSLAKHEEIVEVTRPIVKYDGIYASHIYNQDVDIIPSIEELIDVGRQTGARLQLSHQKVCGKANWGRGRDTLQLMEDARAEGIDILSDLYPYRYTQVTAVGGLFPRWLTADGVDAALERLRDPETIFKLRVWYSQFAQDNPVRCRSLGQTGIIWCKATKEYEGLDLNEAARALGLDAIDAWVQLYLDNDGEVKTSGIMGDEDIEAILTHPYVMIGTDSFSVDDKRLHPLEAHARNYGTYPYILQHYVREQRLLTLEQAIHKMSGAPARRLNLTDRGVLKPSAWADITIFDPKIIEDRASIDSPNEYPAGIKYVLVNGQVTVADDAYYPVFAGQVVRNPKA
ncbi:MAG: N-acyl-D-amino-acid deacylase family protein [Bacillota bacterium]